MENYQKIEKIGEGLLPVLSREARTPESVMDH